MKDSYLLYGIWTDEREPARLYIESDLPIMLTMANDGSYASAMESTDEMKQLVEHLSWQLIKLPIWIGSNETT